ncbi:endonuclease [Alteromonas stellipolaris]|jgi:endonuclease/exonuclease/phosphatase (EEP) superfamily protein YafD|uniref:endonuclease/exonuclease/phosphatase family protein n=1 Tax=Alteromonas TaxID=226 RepID=UPI00076FE6EE|nr:MULTISPECIES: endonuclease/exonuclease/phosphatase family protein [Alteromonas]AMJ91042.1 endonuclease [Alteromonas sp. Mac2]AMJ87180.1 endonuclease [Alteromonas sp. Mac1]AMJ94952.1 endonuclease [Alteromonas stellipolaris]ANB22093.1 endonuclease [Alteromonas stellipolaris]ANB24033.1 endonuclease [Alteromonas stellipolaris]
MNILLNTMAIFLIAATLAPSLPSKHWLVRVWEFPRLQLLGLMVIVLITRGVMYPSDLSAFNTLIIALLYIGLIACAIYQAIWILPYTFFYKKEVVKASSQDAGESISILSSNVFMPNEDYDKLLKHVRDTNPDFVVTLESNKRWEIALSALNETHPHQQHCPLENLYGMHLYSKYPLKTAKLNYLVEDDVPSMLVTIDMDGQDVTLYFLHPKPPSPTENKTAKPRDVELTMVGQEIAKKDGPIIVAGDLNDVAWSPTTRKFKKISGMLDPRIGRAFFNTFHAHYPLVKWPLDHVFHSSHFMLEDIRKLPDIGSDHYPLLTRLKLKPKA